MTSKISTKKIQYETLCKPRYIRNLYRYQGVRRFGKFHAWIVSLPSLCWVVETHFHPWSPKCQQVWAGTCLSCLFLCAMKVRVSSQCSLLPLPFCLHTAEPPAPSCSSPFCSRAVLFSLKVVVRSRSEQRCLPLEVCVLLCTVASPGLGHFTWWLLFSFCSH